jgi:hypothetical protein
MKGYERVKPLGPRAQRFKPPKFQHYLTLGELEQELGKDRSWIRLLEREGRLPEPKRVQYGGLSIRLYSPEQVEECRRIFATHRVGGRRKKNG